MVYAIKLYRYDNKIDIKINTIKKKRAKVKNVYFLCV